MDEPLKHSATVDPLPGKLISNKEDGVKKFFGAFVNHDPLELAKLQRLSGLLLSGVPYPRPIVISGGPSSGKSAYLKILQMVLGKQACLGLASNLGYTILMEQPDLSLVILTELETRASISSLPKCEYKVIVTTLESSPEDDIHFSADFSRGRGDVLSVGFIGQHLEEITAWMVQGIVHSLAAETR